MAMARFLSFFFSFFFFLMAMAQFLSLFFSFFFLILLFFMVMVVGIFVLQFEDLHHKVSISCLDE